MKYLSMHTYTSILIHYNTYLIILECNIKISEIYMIFNVNKTVI